MRWMLTAIAGLALVACATGFEGAPIAEWAGAYGHPQPPPPKKDPNDGGEGPGPWDYWQGEDVLEIRPTSPTQARVDIMLYYPRGHQCSVTAPADLVDGRLALHADNEDGPCRISVRRGKNRDGQDVMSITVDQDGSNACYVYCGANARLSASIPASTRHALPRTPVTQLD